MKNFMDNLHRIYAAISFAEAGEHETARKMMIEQQGRGGQVHKLGNHQKAAVLSSKRPSRRAA